MPDQAIIEPAAVHEERESLGGLFKRLGDDLVTLMRSELRLVSGEFRASILRATGGAAALAVGGLLLVLGLVGLLAALVIFLSDHFGLLGATLIVAIGVLVLGGVAVAVGLGRLKQAEFAPKRVADSLKRDVEALKGD